MGSLLHKLGELLQGGFNLDTGVRKDVEYLSEKLFAMHATLHKVSEGVQWDNLDAVVKVWVNDVRDLSYHIDDVVDGFRVQDEPAANDGFRTLTHQMLSLFEKGTTYNQISDVILDIRERVQKVADLRATYDVNINSALANLTTATTIDPRLPAAYKHWQEIVGIDGTRDELIKRLTDGDDDVQPKIISIFGVGGLGKTTLAKAVYDRLKAQFFYGAFVSVGRKPDTKKVLKDILIELGNGNYDHIGALVLDEYQLINKLQKILQNKRYFIVIDDIWDFQTWETIECALLDNNCGSRVITTTRNLMVAKRSGDVYALEPLSKESSKKLFSKRLFHGKAKCPNDQLPEVSKKILQKCGGVPLAIISIASLLADKPIGNWYDVYTSIGFGRENDNTRKILLFSYYDLPCYLMPCLLHLSIYPEDSWIIKDTLIWKWIAESFVIEEPGIGLFEIGERYFHDLVNRSLVMPIENKEENVIYACRVHDMVVDIIRLLSNEQNFVTILDSNVKFSSSQSNVRRLAIQTREEEQHKYLAKMSMPILRSCYASSCHESIMPPLSSFHVLRVLDLEGCSFLRDCHLEHLGRLLQLRYLSLEATPISQLPEEIGDLKFLQTLDLRETKIEELPQSIGLLRNMKRLRVDSDHRREDVGIIVRNWIGNLTSLEELYLNITGEFSTFVEELGKLIKLRVLVCHLRGCLDDCSKKSLVDSVCELEKIQILHLEGLYGWSMSEADNHWKGYKPPQQLRDLYISTMFSRVPAWINSSLLPNLSKLKIEAYSLKKRDVISLGGLPELLKMDNHLWIPAGMKFPDGVFPKLRSCGINAPFWFLPGSMQSLESITFGTIRYLMEKDAVIDFDFIGTLGNLPSLQVVFAEMNCGGARASDVEKMEAALRRAIHNHPNRPFLGLNKRGEDTMIQGPASPLHHTTSVGTSAQIIIEDESGEAAAGTPAPMPPQGTWRRPWACFRGAFGCLAAFFGSLEHGSTGPV